MAFPRTYRSRMIMLFGLGLGAAIATSLVSGRIVRLGPPGEDFWLVYLALLTPFAVMFAAMMPWWRRLDDVQKSGQTISWWWGGQIGGVVVLMALVAATGPHSDFARGGIAMFLGEAAGFTIYWLIWRFRLRGPVE